MVVVLGMLSFNYFFETPPYDLTVANWPNFIVFAGFLGIAELVAVLVYRMRKHYEDALKCEHEARFFFEEAERARAKAEMEQTRNTLLGAISHDLRTPLSTIKASATALSKEADQLNQEESRDLLELIVAESDRLEHFIGNVLDLMRLESAFIKPRLELQPIEEAIGNVLSRLEPKLGRIDVELPDDLPPAMLDGLLLEQLFVNLIENAYIHGSNEKIKLIAKLAGQSLLLEVSDVGPGILEHIRDHIFEKFFRPHDSPNTGGVGLGLAICRAIVQLHGGRIWVETNENGGASFKFTLPLEPSSASKP
jgi:two-component system sensor histidine kinase KdpD